jgi:hypothetical protein
MIHIERTRKKTNVPEHTREENTYASTHDSRTKEDIDGIHACDDVTTMRKRRKYSNNDKSVKHLLLYSTYS